MSQVGDKRYTNWLKDTLCLLYAKEGIEVFIDNQSATFNAKLKAALGTSTCACQSPCLGRGKKGWVVKKCQCGLCKSWLDRILSHHRLRPPIIPTVVPENVNPKLWPTDNWEVMKVYQPKGCQDQHSASDADLAALLSLMNNCDHFFPFYGHSHQLINEVKCVRNELMHSSNFFVEDSDLADDVKKMLTFLRSLTSLSANESQLVQAAIDKITKFHSSKMELSLDREDELKVLNTKLQVLVNAVDALKTTVLDNSSTALDTSKDVAANAKEIEKMKTQHQQLNVDHTNTRKELAEVKAQSEVFNKFLTDYKIKGVDTEKLSEVTGDIARLEKELTDRIEKLELHNEKTSKRQDVLEKSQGGMKREQGHIKRSIWGLKRTHGKLEKEVKRGRREMIKKQQGVKRTLEGISEEQRQSKKMALDGQPVNAKDIQDRLVGIYSQTCQKIPIYPLRPEWKKHVASVFVMPSMKITHPRGLSEHQMMGADEEPESVVTRIQDIFAPAGSRCADIYIMGDAGSGKSTLCEYLVHLWVSCHTSSNQAPDSEETIMKNFDCLYFLSLRQAISCNVEEMIKHQLQLDDVNVTKLLYDHSSLIILDGLDEYIQKQPSKTRFGSENVPARRYSNKCTFLTTSRPWKIELLTRELEDKIDRQILIVGLDIEGQKKLVGNVFDLMNSEENHVKSPEDFIKEVQTKKLDTFMKTPVILMQMLGLWFSGEPLGSSKCSIYAKLIDKQIQFAEEVRGFPTDPQFQKVAPILAEDQHGDEMTCTVQYPFSTFFKNNMFIMKYKNLLLKMCRFAYCRLSSKDRENSLVFNHEQMELFDMSREEIRVCLHLGLLTQYKVFGEITQRLKSLSFIHKSHHEFFAAIHLSQIDKTEIKPMFEHDFTSLGHILEMETVFMFVCGMNPTVARDMSRFILDKAAGDARMEHYRQIGYAWSTTEPNTALVKRLQNLNLAGIEEGRQNGHKITGMQLHALYMHNSEQDFQSARVLACTDSLDLSNVKSLYIRDIKRAISSTALQKLLKSTSNSLHKVVLWDTVVTVEMIQNFVQQQQGKLQTLGLMNMNVANVDISHLNQTDLQAILSAPTKALALQGIVLTHSQMEFLCQHMSKVCYGDVLLGRLQCTTHGYKANECKQRLDLSAYRNLSRLQLNEIPVHEVLFVPDNLVKCQINYLTEPVSTSILNCLKRSKNLERLQCFSVKGSTVDELSTTLPHLQHLQYILLVDINLSGHQQVVQAFAQMTKLQSIQLWNATMRGEELQKMLSALPSSNRVKVLLGHLNGSIPVTITDYDKHSDILEHVRRNPSTHLIHDDVTFEEDKCIVKRFWFYTQK